MITKAIVDVLRGTADSAIQGMLLAHLEDEWVHSKLLQPSVFVDLAEARRREPGVLWRSAAGIIGAFHTWDERFHRRILGHIGRDAAACDRVLAKVASESNQVARMRSRCGNTLQVLERCGVFGARRCARRSFRAVCWTGIGRMVLEADRRPSRRC